MKTPYTEQLAKEFAAVGKDDAGTLEAHFSRLAEYVAEHLLAPKNQRIHDLTSELAKLQAQVHKLDKVLALHNPGVCRDNEPGIDCAIRMLSPVSDNVPARDRP